MPHRSEKGNRRTCSSEEFFLGSLENVVGKKAGTINLKASGTVPNFKEDRGILAKAGPS